MIIVDAPDLSSIRHDFILQSFCFSTFSSLQVLLPIGYPHCGYSNPFFAVSFVISDVDRLRSTINWLPSIASFRYFFT